MERVMMFLPSILVIAGIAGISFFYVRWIIRRYGDNFKSVEWHQENKWRVAWTVGTPFANIYAPTFEELVFRAPLIVIFSTLSSFAWYGILISSVLFSLIHWFGKKILMPDLFSAQEAGENESDDIELELERIHGEKSDKDILRGRVLHVVMTFLLGILAGYYGIKYQSIWVSVGIHSLWNLLMPIILPLLLILSYIIFMLFRGALLLLWNKIRPQRQV